MLALPLLLSPASVAPGSRAAIVSTWRGVSPEAGVEWLLAHTRVGFVRAYVFLDAPAEDEALAAALSAHAAAEVIPAGPADRDALWGVGGDAKCSAGGQVRLRGLKRAAEYNGETASVVEADGDRVVVRLASGKELRVARRNVETAAPSAHLLLRRLGVHISTEPMARQMLNAAVAAERALTAGDVDWLLHIDSDEIFSLPAAGAGAWTVHRGHRGVVATTSPPLSRTQRECRRACRLRRRCTGFTVGADGCAIHADTPSDRLRPHPAAGSDLWVYARPGGPATAPEHFAELSRLNFTHATYLNDEVAPESADGSLSSHTLFKRNPGTLPARILNEGGGAWEDRTGHGFSRGYANGKAAVRLLPGSEPPLPQHVTRWSYNNGLVVDWPPGYQHSDFRGNPRPPVQNTRIAVHTGTGARILHYMMASWRDVKQRASRQTARPHLLFDWSRLAEGDRGRWREDEDEWWPQEHMPGESLQQALYDAFQRSESDAEELYRKAVLAPSGRVLDSALDTGLLRRLPDVQQLLSEGAGRRKAGTAAPATYQRCDAERMPHFWCDADALTCCTLLAQPTFRQDKILAGYRQLEGTNSWGIPGPWKLGYFNAEQRRAADALREGRPADGESAAAEEVMEAEEEVVFR